MQPLDEPWLNGAVGDVGTLAPRLKAVSDVGALAPRLKAVSDVGALAPPP